MQNFFPQLIEVNYEKKEKMIAFILCQKRVLHSSRKEENPNETSAKNKNTNLDFIKEEKRKLERLAQYIKSLNLEKAVTIFPALQLNIWNLQVNSNIQNNKNVSRDEVKTLVKRWYDNYFDCFKDTKIKISELPYIDEIDYDFNKKKFTEDLNRSSARNNITFNEEIQLLEQFVLILRIKDPVFNKFFDDLLKEKVHTELKWYLNYRKTSNKSKRKNNDSSFIDSDEIYIQEVTKILKENFFKFLVIDCAYVLYLRWKGFNKIGYMDDMNSITKYLCGLNISFSIFEEYLPCANKPASSFALKQENDEIYQEIQKLLKPLAKKNIEITDVLYKICANPIAYTDNFKEILGCNSNPPKTYVISQNNHGLIPIPDESKNKSLMTLNQAWNNILILENNFLANYYDQNLIIKINNAFLAFMSKENNETYYERRHRFARKFYNLIFKEEIEDNYHSETKKEIKNKFPKEFPAHNENKIAIFVLILEQIFAEMPLFDYFIDYYFRPIEYIYSTFENKFFNKNNQFILILKATTDAICDKFIRITNESEAPEIKDINIIYIKKIIEKIMTISLVNHEIYVKFFPAFLFFVFKDSDRTRYEDRYQVITQSFDKIKKHEGKDFNFDCFYNAITMLNIRSSSSTEEYNIDNIDKYYFINKADSHFKSLRLEVPDKQKGIVSSKKRDRLLKTPSKNSEITEHTKNVKITEDTKEVSSSTEELLSKGNKSPRLFQNLVGDNADSDSEGPLDSQDGKLASLDEVEKMFDVLDNNLHGPFRRMSLNKLESS